MDDTLNQVGAESLEVGSVVDAGTDVPLEKEDDNLKQHPLDIVPAEDGEKISKNVDDPTEKLPNSPVAVSHILPPKITQLVLQKFFTILGAKQGEAFISDKLSSSQDPYNRYKETTPLSTEIRNLRLVSPAFRQGIDQFYEDLSVNWFTKQENTPFLPKHWEKYNFGDLCSDANSKPLEFLKDFENTHKGLAADSNPFIGRCASFVDDFGKSDSNKSMENVLAKYGHQLRFVNMIQPSTTVEQVNFSKMNQMLEWMPSLEVLKLENYSSGELLTRDELSDPSALKKFENLKFLCVHNWWAPTVKNIILASNHSLTKLEIHKEKKLQHQEYDIYSIPLPNLTELSVTFYGSEFFKLFYSRVEYPLSVLNIKFHRDMVLDVAIIFKLFECNWKNSLTELNITLPQQQYSSTLPPLELNCLTTLKITLDYFYSLDFLLPLRNSLQVLEITIDAKGARGRKAQGVFREEELWLAEDNQQVKFFTFLEYPMESNLWTLLPKIDKVSYLEYILGVKTRKWSGTRAAWLQERQSSSQG